MIRRWRINRLNKKINWQHQKLVGLRAQREEIAVKFGEAARKVLIPGLNAQIIDTEERIKELEERRHWIALRRL